MGKRAAKGTPTPLNIWTLRDVFKGADEIPNQLQPTSVAGVRKCMTAGLVVVSQDKKRLILTDEGRDAIADLDAPHERERAAPTKSSGERDEALAEFTRATEAAKGASVQDDYVSLAREMDRTRREAVRAGATVAQLREAQQEGEDRSDARKVDERQSGRIEQLGGWNYDTRARALAREDARSLAMEAEHIPGEYERRNMAIDEYGGAGARRLLDEVNERPDADKIRSKAERAYFDAFRQELKRIRPGLREAGDEADA